MPASFPEHLADHVHRQLISRHERPPSAKVLAQLFETLYFASLKREETQAISCRVAFIDRKPRSHQTAKVLCMDSLRDNVLAAH